MKFIPTQKFAESLGVQSASVRRALCVRGDYLGIVPRKLPNGRLLWPAAELDLLLREEEPDHRREG